MCYQFRTEIIPLCSKSNTSTCSVCVCVGQRRIDSGVGEPENQCKIYRTMEQSGVYKVWYGICELHTCSTKLLQLQSQLSGKKTVEEQGRKATIHVEKDGTRYYS